MINQFCQRAKKQKVKTKESGEDVPAILQCIHKVTILTARIWIPSNQRDFQHCTSSDNLRQPENKEYKHVNFLFWRWMMKKKGRISMKKYQKTVSNKLYVVAHQCGIHANQCTWQGLTDKLGLNFHCFTNNMINFLPMKLPLQQTVNNKNIDVSSKCFSHYIRNTRRSVHRCGSSIKVDN